MNIVLKMNFEFHPLRQLSIQTSSNFITHSNETGFNYHCRLRRFFIMSLIDVLVYMRHVTNCHIWLTGHICLICHNVCIDHENV